MVESNAEIRAVAFDLDGVIHIGDTVNYGALTLLEYLRQQGVELFFFTNNSVKSREEVCQKLTGMGVDAPPNRVYTSASCSAPFLVRRGLNKIHVTGSDGLKKELLEQGLVLSDGTVDAILIGLDPKFNYYKLATALQVNSRSPDCRIFACNRDTTYPVENGLMPGCGPIVSAIETATGRRVEAMVGKPSPFMMELLTNDWKLKFSEIMVIGDSFDSDICMAKNCGCPAILLAPNTDHMTTTDPMVKTVRTLPEIMDFFDCRESAK